MPIRLTQTGDPGTGFPPGVATGAPGNAAGAAGVTAGGLPNAGAIGLGLEHGHKPALAPCLRPLVAQSAIDKYTYILTVQFLFWQWV
jgi:hypothetical protein